MKFVDDHDAIIHLAELIDLAGQGRHITITRHGVPVAMLVPPERQPQRSPRETIAQLREFRKGLKLRGLPVRGLIKKGRR